MEQMQGVSLKCRRGGCFRFKMFLTEEQCDVSMDVLDLGVRSSNCLKRAGYITVGDLVRAFADGLDLKNIRNCGAKSVREIMEQLFLYQYTSLSQDKRNEYLKEVVLLNTRH